MLVMTTNEDVGFFAVGFIKIFWSSLGLGKKLNLTNSKHYKSPADANLLIFNQC